MEEKRKRICFVDFDMTLKGGAESVAYELAETLKDFCDVYFLGIKAKNGEPAYQFNDEIHYETLNIEEERFRSVLLAARKKMAEFLKKNKIEIVFMIGSAAGFVTIPQALFKRKVKFVFCDHGALMNEWDDKEIRMMRWLASKFAQRTVVLTERTKQDYIEKFHLREHKLLCIPNWISTRFKENASEYDENAKRIISIGRFGKEKGYDMMVEIAEKIFQTYPDWVWDVYGEGETFEQISDEIEKRGLEKNVLLHGNVEDTTKVYAGHAFLVLPSYREGLPLVLLEAKANHLPCVSFDVMTGPREIIEDEKNGFLIPRYNIEMMVKKLEALMENQELRRTFSQQSAIGIEKFEKEKILNQWLQLISDIGK